MLPRRSKLVGLFLLSGGRCLFSKVIGKFDVIALVDESQTPIQIVLKLIVCIFTYIIEGNSTRCMTVTVI